MRHTTILLISLATMLVAVACGESKEREQTTPLDASDTVGGLDAATMDGAGGDFVMPSDTSTPGDTLMDTADVALYDELDPLCCGTDDDCDTGLVCVGGSCMEPASPPGTCWTSDDCPEDTGCVGVTICECGAMTPCAASTLPGHCEGSGEGCCFTDDMCQDGEVCTGTQPGGGSGNCAPAPGTGLCYDDEDCTVFDPTGVCVGATTCLCEACTPVAGGCAYPTECCTADADCPDGSVCREGVCVDTPGALQCWTDADCPDITTCQGSILCGCDTPDCPPVADTMGSCVAAGECCLGDDDCLPGDTCLMEGGLEPGVVGICVDVLLPGQCFTDDDCFGSSCLGASLCGCGVNCPTTAGTCEYMSCCAFDWQCDTGVCFDWFHDGSGVCMDAPTAPQCYDDYDCATSEYCEGQVACPCDVVCGLPAGPGTCTSLPNGCCTSDASCESGSTCKAQSFDMPGTCKGAPAAADGCWDDKDCSTTSWWEVCLGAYVCGCIATCPACGACMDDQEGTCSTVTYESTCCTTDADCPEGTLCATGAGTTPTCMPRPRPGSCWRDADCGVYESCVGAQVCGCDADCDMETKPGTCLSPDAL